MTKQFPNLVIKDYRFCHIVAHFPDITVTLYTHYHCLFPTCLISGTSIFCSLSKCPQKLFHNLAKLLHLPLHGPPSEIQSWIPLLKENRRCETKTPLVSPSASLILHYSLFVSTLLFLTPVGEEVMSFNTLILSLDTSCGLCPLTL